MWAHDAWPTGLISLDTATGMLSVPVWAAGAAAALLVALTLLALTRAGAAGAAIRLVAILVGAALFVVLLDRAVMREAGSDRAALEARSAELTARAMSPGSPLACLDGWGGETLAGACEKLVFASPDTVAAALSYVAARLALLAEAATLAPDGDARLAPTLNVLRHFAEADRFGLVSHVLATRDGCTPDACPALALLRNPDRVRANLQRRTFETVLARHSGDWIGTAPMAAHPPGAAPAGPGGPAAPAVASSLPDFPSADSIPPVSIMNPEPPVPASPPVAAPPAPRAAAADRPRTPLPPRRPAQPAQTQPAPSGNGPLPIAPPAGTGPQ